MTSDFPLIWPVRKQDEISFGILKHRLETILPDAMRRAGIDMWLVICQEDNDDPVFTTLLPMSTFTHTLQIAVFFDRGPDLEVERILISMANTRGLFEKPWMGFQFKEQWLELKKIVQERDPKQIGINIGSAIWAAGGLTHNLYEQLVAVLPPPYSSRLVSAEAACVHWLMTLCEEELEVYPHIARITHQLIAEVYSSQMIVPGVTTTDDLEWAFWQRSLELGLGLSFRPFFNLVRSDAEKKNFPVENKVIRRGDLIHCDVGHKYLRLCTDQQEWAYICRVGEQDAPQGLKRLFIQVQRLQEVFMSELQSGCSGNEMLASILARARREGIPGPLVYAHSLGHFLHEPGPLIGIPWWDQPNAGRGDVRLNPNTCFSMELYIEDAVPEWGGQQVRFPCEEDVAFTSQGCYPLDGLQNRFYLVCTR